RLFQRSGVHEQDLVIQYSKEAESARHIDNFHSASSCAVGAPEAAAILSFGVEIKQAVERRRPIDSRYRYRIAGRRTRIDIGQQARAGGCSVRNPGLQSVHSIVCWEDRQA